MTNTQQPVRALAPIAFSLALGGCGLGEDEPDLTGTWTGNLTGTSPSAFISAEIAESRGGILSGTVKASYCCGGFGNVYYSAAGQHEHLSVTMKLDTKQDMPGNEHRLLTATVRSSDSLVGKLDAANLTLVRQKAP